MKSIDSKYIVRHSGRGSIRARLLNGASSLALPAFVGALALTLSWPASEALAQCATTGTDQTCTNSVAITGGTIGVDDTGTLTLTNTSTGTISGTLKGINASLGGTFTNSGTIEGTGANSAGIGTGGNAKVTNNIGSTITGASIGLSIAGAADVTNDGKITGTAAGGLGIGSFTSVKVNNTGEITGTAAGISVSMAAQNGRIDVTNSGTIAGADAINGLSSVANVTNLSGGVITGSSAGINGKSVNVIGNDGLIEATAANAVAIGAAGDATVNNSGKILATNGIAVRAGGIATVTNTGDGVNTGRISGSTFGITGGTVNVTGNTGLIEATAANGRAIAATGDVTVDNSGFIRADNLGGVAISGATVTVNNAGGKIFGSDLAIDGHAVTVSNSGDIVVNAGGAVRSDGTVTVTNTAGARISGHTFGIKGPSVNVTSNAGRIESIGTDSTAIDATGGTATVNNLTGGLISGVARAILGNLVNVTNNDGTIETTTADRSAIRAEDTATIANGTGIIRADNGGSSRAIEAPNINVTRNAGSIEATEPGGVAIRGTNDVKVKNGAGGTITGGDIGISSDNTIDIANAAGGTISGGKFGITGSGTVMNAGTISGGTASVQFTGTGTNTLILKNSSVLNGDAVGSVGATNQLILQGAGTANNNFRNFNTLDVQDALWTLNGDSAVGTATIFSSASLLIGEDAGHSDARLAGNVTVNSGGTLGGAGTIDGNVTVLGTLYPGYTTANGTTLTVTGNVSFASGSTFRVNANSDGSADKVSAGTATLNGGTVDVRAGGTFQPLTQYVILQTNSGVSGTFSNVTSNLAFLTPSLTYGATNVFLDLVSNSTVAGSNGFAGAAQTRNQTAVATALDGGATSNPLITAVLNQSVDGARRAFDALSGEVYGSVHNAQAEEAQFARGAMLGRMRQASYAGAPGELGALGFAGPQLAYASGTAAQASAYPVKAPYGPSRDLTFWSLGLGGWGHSDGDGNAASLTSRFGGFLSGVDARFGESWRAGFTAGYVRTDLHANDRASSAGIDSVQLGAYATGRLGMFNVRGGGSYSFDDIDASRSIFFPGFTDQTKARLHGNVGQVFGEVGYGMALGNFALEPLAGLAYVHLRNGSFNESGGAAALTGSATHENLGYSSLGLRLASIMPLANGTVLVPRATVAWQYAFGDVTPSAALAFQGTGTAFSVAGVPVARNSALVEGGFDWRFTPQAKLGVSYLGELAASAQTHAIKGAFTWDF
jgi:outer membrane autotransporter protein